MRKVKGTCLLFCISFFAPISMAEITDVRQLELHNILKQDCGSCHGLTLKGGLGPALTTVAMKKKPRSVMLATILDGRAGTPMPPWKSILSREEVDWLLDVLYGGSSRDQ